MTTTEDTVIQGKSCRKMAYLDWICDAWPPPNFTYIHQDGGKVYRYDLADQEFQLVLDYTKQVGESWQVKVCQDIFGTDTVTITVDWASGYQRGVTVYSNETGVPLIYLILVEGVGGTWNSNRLLLVHPSFSTDCNFGLLCYKDPTVGEVFTMPPGCIESAVEEEPQEKQSAIINIYPNPTASESTLHYQLPPATGGDVHVYDLLGRLIASHQVQGGQGWLVLPAYPVGLYFVAIMVNDEIVGKGKLVRM